MRPLLLRSLGFVGCAALAVACTAQTSSSSSSSSSTASDAPTTGTVTSPIINGNLDATHPAVVMLYLEGASGAGLCSGTIVKVDAQRHIGWVATAAHCVDEVPPELVLQTDDFEKPDSIKYQVLDYKADARYVNTGNPYDFAMVRIGGVDAQTPVIPLTGATDGLTTGTAVTSVGFGRTSESDQDMNSQRRNVSKTLGSVTTTKIAYEMSTKGICQGDSGGPVLAGTGVNEKVVGIHSYVEGGCVGGNGYSGRVSAGLTFYNGELTKALPDDTCTTCEKIALSGKLECAVMNDACLKDKDCKGISDCIKSGKTEAVCAKQFPLAEGPYKAAVNCVCQKGCQTQCATDATCKSLPKCGYKLPAGDCTTCVESTCCTEETECAADGECYSCLKSSDKEDYCKTNAKRKALANCAAQKCTDQCKDEAVGAGGDPPPEPEAPANAAAPATTTTTITKDGCSTSPSGAAASGSASPFAVMGVALGLAAALRRKRKAA
jgi:MYXO-CTERM domain-containing protein